MADGPGTDVSDLLARAAAEDPDRLAIVESGGRRGTGGGLEDEVGRLATGLGAAGIVAGHRVMVALGNRIEFVTTYLAVLRAHAVAVPVNPTSQAGEVARMIADSGSRLVVTDGDTVAAVRDAVRALQESRDHEYPEGSVEGDLLARLVVPRVVLVSGEPEPGERSYAELRADIARAVPPLLDPEKLAALLYTSGTSGRPRAAMLTHRALLANIEQVAAVNPPMIHGDDVVLGVLPLFHVYGLNAVLGVVMRHRAKLVLSGRFEAQGTLDLIEDEACSVVPVAPPVFGYWQGVDGLEERLGPVRLMLSGGAPLAPGRGHGVSAAVAGAGPGVHRAHRHPDPPGLRPDRGRAGRDQHAVQPGAAAGVRGRGAAGHRDPAGGRDGPPARGRGRRGDPDQGPQPVQRLLARRRQRPRHGGLVVDRRRRLPGRERRPVSRGPAQGAGDRVRFQRLPGRGRGRDPRGPRCLRGRGDRRGRPADGRGGRGVRRRLGRVAGGRRTRLVRGAAGPVQAAEPDRGGPRAARGRHRQGPEGPAARHGAPPSARTAGVTTGMTARVTLYSKPGCHLCDDARAVVERVCADLGESYEEVSILEDPALQERYAEEIPVTLVDGKQHDFWRVDEFRLRAALAPPAPG